MAEQEPIITFKVPERVEVKAYLVKLPDGRYVVRSEDELQEIPKEVKESGKE